MGLETRIWAFRRGWTEEKEEKRMEEKFVLCVKA